MNSNRRKKPSKFENFIFSNYIAGYAKPTLDQYYYVLLRNVTVYSVHMGNLNNGKINLAYSWENR